MFLKLEFLAKHGQCLLGPVNSSWQPWLLPRWQVYQLQGLNLGCCSMRSCGIRSREESICFRDRSPFFCCEGELEESCGFGGGVDQTNVFIPYQENSPIPTAVQHQLCHIIMGTGGCLFPCLQ